MLKLRRDWRQPDASGRRYNAMRMETGLKGRVAIVAASSQGIGRATAEGFAAEGCRVAMCARNAAPLEAAAENIRNQSQAEVFAQAFDVAGVIFMRAVGEIQAGDVHAEAKQVAHRGFGVARRADGTDDLGAAERFGGVDICVTNAGGPPAKRFMAASLEEWRKAVDANFLSTVYFARAVIPHMQRKRWGRIITLTSISTKQPVPDLVLSNAVRAAVVGLVKSLANEFGKDGITVNNVGPGYTATDRLKELARARSAAQGKTEEEVFASWANEAALKRVAEPREVADAIIWLASERASYVTGQTILVDGGAYKGL